MAFNIKQAYLDARRAFRRAEYEYKKSLGVCTRPACGRKTIKNESMCVYHRVLARENAQKNRKKEAL